MVAVKHPQTLRHHDHLATVVVELVVGGVAAGQIAAGHLAAVIAAGAVDRCLADMIAARIIALDGVVGQILWRDFGAKVGTGALGFDRLDGAAADNLRHLLAVGLPGIENGGHGNLCARPDIVNADTGVVESLRLPRLAKAEHTAQCQACRQRHARARAQPHAGRGAEGPRGRREGIVSHNALFPPQGKYVVKIRGAEVTITLKSAFTPAGPPRGYPRYP